MDDIPARLGELASERGSDVAFSDVYGTSVTYIQLARLVNRLTDEYRSLLPETVGLLAPAGIAWVAANLALIGAGKTVVPLPDFFSPDQLRHIVADAGIGHILTVPAMAEQARDLSRNVSAISLPVVGRTLRLATDRDAEPPAGEAGRLVIYTSGSTGRPKGVCLGMAQIGHSARTLAAAIGATAGDTYLSVLPISLLLEQVCAIYVPLHAGVRVVFGTGGTDADLSSLADLVQPTLMVLVPQLLRAWTTALEGAGRSAPESLRFVATGGAPVGEMLAAAAWRAGIPVHEGYGLSECCSVVAVNRPGDRRPGTVGRPLDGIDVSIDDGEIVVRGPTVMDGYLGAPVRAPGAVWHTGDLGALDADGRLVVYGRKDNLLITAAGRNIVPEWIEAMIGADPRLAHCVLTRASDDTLAVILVPYDADADAFRAMSDFELAAHVDGLTASAPDYARPSWCFVVAESDFRRRGLLTGNGRPRRDAIAAEFSRRDRQLSAAL